MIKILKSLNSRAFLAIYLVVITVILTLWLSGSINSKPDHRTIPAALKSYLQSPPKPLPQLLFTNMSNGSIFTNASFETKWSFVYFTHGHCMPQCAYPLSVFQQLQTKFIGQGVQYILINIDDNKVSSTELESLSNTPDFQDAVFLTSDISGLQDFIQQLGFLYLRTESNTGYFYEQEHRVFLIDPKARYYASFPFPTDSQSITDEFISIRSFYARTE